MRLLQLENSILTESCDGLTADQRRIVEGAYQAMLPLFEMNLDSATINQVIPTLRMRDLLSLQKVINSRLNKGAV